MEILEYMPKDEDVLLEIFAQYDFKDKEGHSLLLCEEFLLLLRNYCEE